MRILQQLKKHHCNLAKCAGFTLLELMVSIAILGIVSALMLNRWPTFSDSLSRNSSRKQLQFDIERARGQAVSRGARVVLIVNSDHLGYQVGLDYYPFANPAAIESALFTRELPAGISMSASANVIFDTRGYLINDSGALASTSVSLAQRGTTFLTSTVYPTGAITNV